MKKGWMKIKNIVKGWYFRCLGKNKELFDERFKHCNKCSSLIYITKREAICKECGCPIKSKLVVKDEYCLLKKW